MKEASGEKIEVKTKKNYLWKPLLLITFIIAIVFLVKVLGLTSKFGELRDWIQGLGPKGASVFITIYIGFVIFALPGSVITVAAGALYGSFWGVVLVSFASTAGATLAFLISRYFARSSVENWLKKKEKFKKLDAMTERQGDIIVAITRLVPIFPFNLLNYGFGLTQVKLKTYVFWSWLCMLPGTVLYVVGSDAIFKGLKSGKIPWSLVAIAASVLVIITIIAKRAKKRISSSGGKNAD